MLCRRKFMNLANKITIARILLIPIFILLFPIYPDWLIHKSSMIQHIESYGIYYASAALILLVSQHLIYSWIAFAIIAREIIITGIRLVAASQKIALQADQFGKIKMVFQVVGISAVLLNNDPFSFITEIHVDQLLMYIALILTIYSGYNYIKNNFHMLNL
jgi:CDP-diacylglycerol--glycerol-3-phosphate 3-phosphatidyltransferase